MQQYTVSEYSVPHRGRIVTGRLYLPGSQNRRPLVIFSHGYNGSQADFANAANLLAEHEIAAFCLDFCGGSVRAQCSLKTTDMTLFTEAEDLEAALDAFHAHKAIDADRIFLFGGSQGGMVTAIVAARRVRDVKGVVLLYPALCIADNWREKFPKEEDIPDEAELWGMKLGRAFFESIRTLDPFSLIGDYSRDVLILHGKDDDVVPLSYSERAQKIYPHAELIVFPQEGHGFSPEGDRIVARLLLGFVQARI